MNKPMSPTTKIEKICRLIVESREVMTDDLWEIKWKLHTGKYSIEMGGKWNVYVAAERIMEICNEG